MQRRRLQCYGYLQPSVRTCLLNLLLSPLVGLVISSAKVLLIEGPLLSAPRRQGFAVFLAAADGTNVNSQKISLLTSLRWIDKNTRSLQVAAPACARGEVEVGGEMGIFPSERKDRQGRKNEGGRANKDGRVMLRERVGRERHTALSFARIWHALSTKEEFVRSVPKIRLWLGWRLSLTPAPRHTTRT